MKLKNTASAYKEQGNFKCLIARRGIKGDHGNDTAVVMRSAVVYRSDTARRR